MLYIHSPVAPRQRYFKSVSSWCVLLSLAAALFTTQFAYAGSGAELPAPAWSGARSVTSDDGYAELAWAMPDGEYSEVYRVSETHGDSTQFIFVDRPSLRVYRVDPGGYEFQVQACLKTQGGTPQCGASSARLRLRVMQSAAPAPSGNAPDPQLAGSVLSGGPDQLRPGAWINVSKDGQGWDFYWANRLALPESDPLFGNAYDLLGIWYTFEAKDVFEDNEVCHCIEPITYRPVVAQLKLVRLDSNTYTGGIWITRNGLASQVGSANVIFGSNNTSATVNWSANFKNELISAVSDPISLLLGPDPGSSVNHTHYSGLWENPQSQAFLVDENIGSIAEVVGLTFQDAAGDPVWVQALSTALVPGNVDLCFSYLKSGYPPDENTPPSWTETWHNSGCDRGLPPGASNRNAGRYFTDFTTEKFWAAFTLPGTPHATGSVTIGSPANPATLAKSAGFHQVHYDFPGGSSCEITDAVPSCTVQLSWFTDGDYPDATVFIHDQAGGSRSLVQSSAQPVMLDQIYSVSTAGNFQFELRMGAGSDSSLMAVSQQFVVTDNSSPPTPPVTPVSLNAAWDDQAGYVYTVQWGHTDPQAVAYYRLQEWAPASASPVTYTLSPGTAVSRTFSRPGGPFGNYTYQVQACNAAGCSTFTPALNWQLDPPGPPLAACATPGLVFCDDFETDLGWVTNALGTDTAIRGQWERNNPVQTSAGGVIYQAGETVSGEYALVTGAAAGSSYGSYDVDQGVTRVTSPPLELPAGGSLTLNFSYYLAHTSSARSGDFFRAIAQTAGGDVTLLQELGSAQTDPAVWAQASTDLSAYGGQTIRLRFEAADDALAGSIIEAAVDDVYIVFSGSANRAPAIDDPGTRSNSQNDQVDLLIPVSDADGDTLSCSDGGTLPAALSAVIDAGGNYCLVSGLLSAPAGSYAVTITVEDEHGLTDSVSFNWLVTSTGPGSPETPPLPAEPPGMTPSATSSRAGATQGQFRVDEMGSATYTIPLLTAPGSGGLAPRVSLDYSSQSGNGPVGMGWKVGGLSVISRCSQTLESDGPAAGLGVSFTSSDRFCLDGQRLLLVAGTYGADGAEYRTEIDPIARIRSMGAAGNGPAWFTVELKNGTYSEYGNSSDSRIEARLPGDNATVMSWAQNRLTDRAGNYVTYEYSETSTPVEFVIDEIHYTGNEAAATAPYAKLVFVYSGDREDGIEAYMAGAHFQQSRLLTRIDSLAKKEAGSPYTTLRAYHLGYAQDGMGRSALQSVQECNNAARQYCFDQTSFTWQNSLHGIASVAGSSGILPSNQVVYGLQMADLSGNGLPEILYTQSSGKGKNLSFNLKIKSAGSSGSYSSWGGNYTLPRKENGAPPPVFGIDLNADGFQDVIYPRHDGGGSYAWAGRLSDGTSLGAEQTLSSANFNLSSVDAEFASKVSVMDFNGDGLADILYNTTSLAADVHDLEVALNTYTPGGAAGFAAPLVITSDFSDSSGTGLFPGLSNDGTFELYNNRPAFYESNSVFSEGPDTPANRVFDFNGDGAVDLLLYVWREYRRCISNCPDPQSSEALGSLAVQAAPAYEYAVAAFWVLMKSNGSVTAPAYDYEVVARGRDCNLSFCLAYNHVPAAHEMWPVDINADGLADLAYSADDNHWKFRLNSGNGLGAAQAVTASPLTSGHQDAVRFQDMNGDGFADMIYPALYNNDNANWKVAYNRFGQSFDSPVATGIKAGRTGGETTEGNDASIFADFNGDARADLLFINFDTQGNTPVSNLYAGVNLLNAGSAAEPVNVITRITNGIGAETTLEYKPLTDPAVYTRMGDSGNADFGAGSAVYDVVAPVYVVSRVSASAPTFSDPGATADMEYHYVGAKLQAGGRGFLGFGEIISYDPQNGIRTNTRYRQDFPYAGQVADTTQALASSAQKFHSISVTSAGSPVPWGAVSATTAPAPLPSGTRLSYVINEWSTLVTAGGAVYPYLSNTLQRSYTLAGNLDRKVLTSTAIAAHGNVANKTIRTYATDGAAAFAAQATANQYSDDISAWRLGQLVFSTVVHSRTDMPDISRQTSFGYDVETGILNREIVEPNRNAFKVTTDYTLDVFGNRTVTTITGSGLPSRSSYLVYEPLGRFTIETRNALNQVTSRVNDWDAYGNALEAENVDGVLTFSAADHLGRPFISYTETGDYRKTLLSSSLGICPAGTAVRLTITGGGIPDQVQCQDLLGRTVRSATAGFDGTMIYHDQYYDSSGRPERVSEPYYAGSTRYWNLSTYDPAGRLTSMMAAGGEDQIFEYDEDPDIACTPTDVRATQTTNALGQIRVELVNALGQTTDVYDDGCGHISYSYDATGNLVSVTGADSETVTMAYDLAGRKITLDDPDKGYWQYAYNALGELLRQLDTKSQAIDYEYDNLGRVIERRELNNVGGLSDSSYNTLNRETTVFQNGTAASVKGKGQPVNVIYRTGESGAIVHQRNTSYDAFGRTDVVTTYLEGAPFTEQTTYDQYGRIFQQFDASGDDRGLRYVYNAHGYQAQVKEAREGISGRVYQDVVSMDARGNATQVLLGNGVEAFANYEPQSGRLLSLSAYRGVSEIQEVDYLFDVLGNLRQRHDQSGATNMREQFSYDGLNRLSRVDLSVAGASFVQTLSLGYNSAGNISYKSDVGTYVYGGSQPHAVTSAGGTSYSYDSNGNQVSGDGRTISYTVFDKAQVINKGSSQAVFAYGIANTRYKREDQQGGVIQKTTRYLGSVEHIDEGGSTSFKRYLAGVAIASFHPATNSQSIAYLLKDHIGSIHTVLDESGQVTATMHFSAFGQRQDSNWQSALTPGMSTPLNDITTRGFTGHEQVDDLDIVHMNGRIYDARLGRFLQADPIVQAPKNTQSLNRYSYVLNNPLSYTDPSGYFSLSRFVKRWGRVIVAAVASYFTYGAANGWLAGTSLAGNGIAIGAISGGLSGLVGGALISGTASGAFNGALAGALMGGVAGHFGNTYSVKRIAADSFAGGVSATIQGGDFRDGLKIALSVSALTFFNYRMDSLERTNSAKNPDNLNKPGSGLFGRRFSIAGARRTVNLNGEYLPCGSLAGGCQGLPIPGYSDQTSNLLGIHYGPDGAVGYLVDTFAGPHDWLRNHVSRSYDALGNSKYLTGFRQYVDRVANAMLIPVATPFSIAAVIGTQPSVFITLLEYLYDE